MKNDSVYTVPKNIKYPVTDLTKDVTKAFYTGNYKKRHREIKGDLTNGKRYEVHGLEDSILLKW